MGDDKSVSQRISVINSCETKDRHVARIRRVTVLALGFARMLCEPRPE